VNKASGQLLLIGYGNPGRLDDGLGPAMVEAIAGLEIPGVDVDSDYQLTLEDASDVANYAKVVFVDADVSGPEPFWCKRIAPSEGSLTFSTHSISPEGVLQVARDLFHAEPECWLMGIRGYEFNEFGEALSKKAQANLAEAVAWLESAIRGNALTELRAEESDWASRPQIEARG